MEKNRFISRILETDTEIGYELSYKETSINSKKNQHHTNYHFTMKWEILTKRKLSQIP